MTAVSNNEIFIKAVVDNDLSRCNLLGIKPDGKVRIFKDGKLDLNWWINESIASVENDYIWNKLKELFEYCTKAEVVYNYEDNIQTVMLKKGEKYNFCVVIYINSDQQYDQTVKYIRLNNYIFKLVDLSFTEIFEFSPDMVSNDYDTKLMLTRIKSRQYVDGKEANIDDYNLPDELSEFFDTY